jgi:hypothetical protein
MRSLASLPLLSLALGGRDRIFTELTTASLRSEAGSPQDLRPPLSRITDDVLAASCVKG